MIPMKTQNVVDSCLVDEIFYKINEIYMHHATFIAFLARAMHDANTTIGDVISRNVSSFLTPMIPSSATTVLCLIQVELTTVVSITVFSVKR